MTTKQIALQNVSQIAAELASHQKQQGLVHLGMSGSFAKRAAVTGKRLLNTETPKLLETRMLEESHSLIVKHKENTQVIP